MTIESDERPVKVSDRWPWPRWMIALLLVGHALATCYFLPPAWLLEQHVYVGHDYALHAHRAHVYREALWRGGLPWGIDPRLCAGRVIHPTQDASSKSHQVLAALLPFVSADKVVFGYSLAAVLLCPVLFVLGGRMLRFDWDELSVGLLIVMGVFWLTMPFQVMLVAGMSSFVLCTFFGLVALGAYFRFFREPTVRNYAFATAAGGLLFLIHPLGPLAVVLPLMFATVAAPMTWGWRIATALSPVLIAAVNAFWLIPLILGIDTPAPPWSDALIVDHAFWTWNETYRFSDFVNPIVGTGLGAMLLAVAVQLIRRGWRKDWLVAVSLALVLGTGLFLFVWGSDVEATRKLQPVRYCIVVLTVSSLLLGSLAADVNRWLFLPRQWTRHALAGIQAIGVVLVVAAAFVLGPQLVKRTDDLLLAQYVYNFVPKTDRMLIESESRDSSLTQALPMFIDREVVSNAFPDYPDPVQFVPQRLFGKSPGAMSIEELRRGLDHFGIDRAFVRSEEWRALFRELTGEPGETVGAYLVFKMPGDRSAFLVGSGSATASVNRIRLRDVIADEGRVVLRYRYHPGWVCPPPSSIEPYPIEEDPGGLIEIRNPTPDMALRFDPVRALSQPWSQKTSGGP